MNESGITIEEVTDPVEVARFKAQEELAQRNSDWLEAHWGDLLPAARGRYLAVAGEEAFIADRPEDAIARAKAAHPHDTCMPVKYVRKELGWRIYANQWPLGEL